ncbi:unnamed protein product [Protopolystoma xenopodis]|uniref:Uncharacterized protein n=1 Tax=Protopolystoma xenopodis TaxID=117903 RepID=A0A3S5BU56_9PLAT|nr:unnamed protein product [Protopolystoma xenopodis]
MNFSPSLSSVHRRNAVFHPFRQSALETTCKLGVDTYPRVHLLRQMRPVPSFAWLQAICITVPHRALPPAGKGKGRTTEAITTEKKITRFRHRTTIGQQVNPTAWVGECLKIGCYSPVG